MILDHLDKNNLHHAYLIEGAREDIVPEILGILNDFGISTTGNPDFTHITVDNFKMDEALSLREMSLGKSFADLKKIFIVAVNTFSLDAENVLLKMFEEPIENTHFFVIVPDSNVLLKTLVSRFYLIKSETAPDTGSAEKFLSSSLPTRLNFIKDLLTEDEEEDEEGNEIVALDSTRSQALKFLNALESALHRHGVSAKLEPCFEHYFKVREFLRMPGSSAKSLLESVALITPIL